LIVSSMLMSDLTHPYGRTMSLLIIAGVALATFSMAVVGGRLLAHWRLERRFALLLEAVGRSQ
jgi:hypothetical protein